MYNKLIFDETEFTVETVEKKEKHWYIVRLKIFHT